MDLLEHKMLVAALFCSVDVPVCGHHFLFYSVAVKVCKGDAIFVKTGDLAAFQKIIVPGAVKYGRNVRSNVRCVGSRAHNKGAFLSCRKNGILEVPEHDAQ